MGKNDVLVIGVASLAGLYFMSQNKAVQAAGGSDGGINLNLSDLFSGAGASDGGSAITDILGSITDAIGLQGEGLSGLSDAVLKLRTDAENMSERGYGDADLGGLEDYFKKFADMFGGDGNNESSVPDASELGYQAAMISAKRQAQAKAEGDPERKVYRGDSYIMARESDIAAGGIIGVHYATLSEKRERGSFSPVPTSPVSLLDKAANYVNGIINGGAVGDVDLSTFTDFTAKFGLMGSGLGAEDLEASVKGLVDKMEGVRFDPAIGLVPELPDFSLPKIDPFGGMKDDLGQQGSDFLGGINALGTTTFIAGKSTELVGTKVAPTATKAVLGAAKLVLPKVASRAIPVLGWGLLAGDIIADVGDAAGIWESPDWLGFTPMIDMLSGNASADTVTPIDTSRLDLENMNIVPDMNIVNIPESSKSVNSYMEYFAPVISEPVMVPTPMQKPMTNFGPGTDFNYLNPGLLPWTPPAPRRESTNADVAALNAVQKTELANVNWSF